ncbi:uncharacterized protein LOC105434805 [Cucumis sativus]|uniref:Uncharacterized protein n=1 Tax=Cucumis sativus TaxID=3659 RepID=A0A0A0L3K9_CUCSA|nr:uncharacterized protein LOC105434805 [Cucumis sativus]KGN56348.1 hypothetical protein Csa_011596 [Cucumis sativus]
MGNCMLKGAGAGAREEEVNKIVKVVTVGGGIMELYTPITAECITGEYPGHAIFKTRSIFSDALHHKEELEGGQVYYLLPLNQYIPNHNHSVLSTPYRMSTAESQTKPDHVMFPKYNNAGVWKVNLVICPQQLSQILSQNNRTQELIDNVRTVAKCGNALESASNSDHSSVAGSWKDKPHYGFK